MLWTTAGFDFGCLLECAMRRRHLHLCTVEQLLDGEQEGTSEFFNTKYFMKGTIPLTFNDKLTWEQFNIAAARGRKWVDGGFA